MMLINDSICLFFGNKRIFRGEMIGRTKSGARLPFIYSFQLAYRSHSFLTISMSYPERATTFIHRCFIVPVHRNVDNIVRAANSDSSLTLLL